MITNRDTAKLVIETLHRIKEELRSIHSSVEATCTADESQTYNYALGRILHHVDTDILQPLYRTHPDIRPAGWSILDEKPSWHKKW